MDTPIRLYSNSEFFLTGTVSSTLQVISLYLISGDQNNYYIFSNKEK